MPSYKKEFDEVLPTDGSQVLKETGIFFSPRPPKKKMSRRVFTAVQKMPEYVDKFGKGMNDFSDQIQNIGKEGREIMESMTFDMDLDVGFDDRPAKKKKREADE